MYPPPRSKVRNFTVCVNTSSTRCDFSHLNLSVYGRYTGWVTALLGDESSGWANSNVVVPDIDSEDRPSSRQLHHARPPLLTTSPLSSSAVIGPPNVTLVSDWTTIEVNIRDPEFAMSTLKDVYSVPVYNVTYWKDGQMDKVRRRVILVLGWRPASARPCLWTCLWTWIHSPIFI